MDQATDLRALVRQVATAHAPAVPRPRRIVVFGGKGGLGTTTIAVNLAVALAQQGTRSLLCDAAGGDVTLQCGLEPQYTLADALAGNRTVAQVVLLGPAGVQVLPGTRDLARSQEPAEHAWNHLMTQFQSLRDRPETVIVDAGSRPDPVTRQLWQAADRVLLVASVETSAIMNAYASVKLLTDLTRPVSIALLVNRAPGKRWPKRRNNGWPRPAGVFWAWPCAVWATCRKTAQCRNPPRGANRSCWPSRPVRPVCTCGKRRGRWELCRGAAARGGVGRDFSKNLIQRNQENDAEVTIGGTKPRPALNLPRIA